MKCPFCGCKETRVVDSREAMDGAKIRRRRLCEECNRRFTTHEIIESVPIVVIKKDKSRQAFDRDKLLKGMLRACEKRPVTLDELNKAVIEIEMELNSSAVKEVSSEKIGELALEKMRDIDDVAYVRFASVYRRFNDVDSFLNELSLLREKDK